MDQHPQFEFDLKWTANSMYSASIDTVSPCFHSMCFLYFYLSARRRRIGSVISLPSHIYLSLLPSISDLPRHIRVIQLTRPFIRP